MNLTLVFSNEYIKLEVDQELRFLQTTWLRQPTSSQFREQLQQVVDYALANNINKALFNVRQRAYLEMADQNWLTREIVPLFAQKKSALCLCNQSNYFCGIRCFPDSIGGRNKPTG
ncbi:hypothetical protein [Adhaeribacter pallidiroseus]|uniref:Uncharacterized protein n=1 Tax=Adhaeribacter pallidiroseus TaxID=2072847 RepID=A0A369QL79_9BACT|nr:hypothetical protein [Adhaeribacter pallidiroseus]RDC63599.1 hypothetical protein AHMF7616_02204 [Adhaeribacter pallidiroseus]